MPLNEASAPRSDLTAAQKRQALNAIYGIAPEPTDAEIEQLRELLSEDENPKD
jgi:hypothetical protein